MSVTFYSGAEGSPEVIIEDPQAHLLLETLGLDDIDDNLYGHCEAQDFMGRLLLAGAIGRTSRGRTPGFLRRKLDELHSLADYATEKDLQILWS